MDQAGIAARIRELRKENQLSQEQFAERLGVSRQTVSKWELAEASPDIERIIQISRQFGVSTDRLLTGQMGWYESEDYRKEKQRQAFHGKLLKLAGWSGLAFMPTLGRLTQMFTISVTERAFTSVFFYLPLLPTILFITFIFRGRSMVRKSKLTPQQIEAELPPLRRL